MSSGSSGDEEEGGISVKKRAQSALPFTPLHMTFRNLQYSVPMPKVGAVQYRTICHDLQSRLKKLLFSLPAMGHPLHGVPVGMRHRQPAL